jgi:hypothetical protein
VSKHSPTNAVRQRRKRERLTARGLVQFSGWVPPHARDDLRELVETLQRHPHLTVGTALDPVSGKFVSRRNRDGRKR